MSEDPPIRERRALAIPQTAGPAATLNRRLLRADSVVPLLVVVLAAASVALLIVPDVRFVSVAPELDVVINTSTTLVAVGVAGLAWSRWRETRLTAQYFEAAAFVVLSLSGLIFIILMLTGGDRAIGMSLSDPRQTPLYMRASARLIAGVLLLLAARPVVGLLAGDAVRLARGLVAAYAIGVVVLVAVGDALPALINSEGLSRLRADPEVPAGLPGITALGAIVHLAGASLFLGAAALLVRRRDTPSIHQPPYFAAGLVVAAFSELHAAVYPGTFTSLVTTADVLRLAFYAMLLVGINADIRADLRALRDANAELARLRPAELARAALEERAHLAREIHDGVAQELWLARLKAGQLADEQRLDRQGEQTLTALTNAIDAGLGEVSHAVIALRARADRSGIVAVLEEYLEEFRSRFGIPVLLDAPGDLPIIDPRREADSLRIVQEALNNARKHADPTLVRITLSVAAAGVAVTVADNGRGFDPAATIAGFGLNSMAERAKRMGAAFDVQSTPSEGTVVRFVIPTGDGPAS